MMDGTFKAAFFPTAVCPNRVMAARILPKGPTGVAQETRIDRSLARR